MVFGHGCAELNQTATKQESYRMYTVVNNIHFLTWKLWKYRGEFGRL